MIGRNRVVITGLGVLAANGIGKDAFWNSLLAGESGIGPITQFDASDLPCKIAGEIKGFNPLNYMEAALKPRRMSRVSQLCIAAARLAIEDAHFIPSLHKINHAIPIVIGVSTSDFDTILGTPKAYSTSALIPHAPATSLASILKIECELITISNACTSGLDAIAIAADKIKAGKADIAIAGGTDSSINEKAFHFLSRGNMLPTDKNDTPKKASRPFDLWRTGGVLAEGSAMVVIESEEHARARNAPIYAEILGYGSSLDLGLQSNKPMLTEAMLQAINNSSLDLHAIDYINAHAPSDPRIDIMETNAIKLAFGKRAYSIPISSIKGSTGNPLGAGGSMQFIATSLALRNQCLPSTTNYEAKDPDCDLDYIPGNSRIQSVEHALINSRGVSGNNSALVIKARP